MQNTNNSNSIKLNINKFVKAISVKNYAEANKYLKNAINEKIKTKISKVAK